MRKAGKVLGILLICVAFLIIGYRIGLVIKENRDAKATPPSNTRYPSESAEDWAKFDNESEIYMDENLCTVTYTDGTKLEAPRATREDIIFLNEHLSEFDLSWINFHTGTCAAVFTLEYEGTKYQYFQHLVDTEYVFVNKQPVN